MTALKQRYFEPSRTTSPVLYEIDADIIQDIVEPNLGRKLTLVELERMHYAFLENETAYFALMDFILAAARDAMSNSETDWSSVDRDCVDRVPEFTLNGYPIGM